MTSSSSLTRNDEPQPLTQEMRRRILAANDEMTQNALRVLGVLGHDQEFRPGSWHHDARRQRILAAEDHIEPMVWAVVLDRKSVV